MKKTLRREMRAVIRSLSLELRHARALAAAKLLLAHQAWRAARTIFVYLSTEREMDSTALVDAAWRGGKRVLAPRVDPVVRMLEPIEMRSWSDCLPGHRGVVEPLGGEAFPLEEIDLLVVPALAFDVRGHRLGQGRGYYDRFLATPGLRGLRCGLAFEDQIVERVADEPHDEPVDMVVTEAEVREFRPLA